MDSNSKEDNLYIKRLDHGFALCDSSGDLIHEPLKANVEFIVKGFWDE